PQLTGIAACRMGGALCRPQDATVDEQVWNRGVSDPPMEAADLSHGLSRRVAHAPIPCPGRAADPGPTAGPLIARRRYPAHCSAHPGVGGRLRGCAIPQPEFGGKVPWR